MGLWRDLLRFLMPYQRFHLNHGGRLINPYDLTTADEDEKVLILAGVARSPDDARLLMAKLGTTSAKQVLKIIARHKERITVKQRLKVLLARIDGHDPRDAYGGPKYEQPTIRVQYRYRNRY